MTVMLTHSTPGFEMTNNLLCLGTYGLFGNGEGSGMRPVRTYLPGSKIEGNTFIGQPTAEYPANNVFTAAVSSVGFTDAVAGNYKLTAASPYRGKARDGQDPGPNMDLFERSQKGVLNGTLRALLNSDAIVNTASFEQKLSPGARVTIFGENMAECTAVADPPVRSICSTEVLVNSNPVPIFYVSPSEILIQLPAALPVNQAAEVMVRRREENNSDQVMVEAAAIQAVAPALYFYRLTGETNRRAFMMQSDGTFNGPGVDGLGPGTFRPVRPGEEVTVFLNAAGPTDPPVEDGELAPADPPSPLVNPPDVYIDDVPQQIRFAGAIPYTAGLFSVRFVVDPTVGQRPEGNQLWINVANTESPRLQVMLSR